MQVNREIFDNSTMQKKVPHLHLLRKELQNIKDIEFLGSIYLGSPTSQKARVVLDTGSDWLTIKGCLSEAHCHTRKIINLIEQNSKLKGKPVEQPDTVYFMNQTVTGQAVNNIGFPLSYGSANLEGFKFQDFVCLLPLNISKIKEVKQSTYDNHYCVKELRFQSIMSGQGLEMADGILGLSPKNYGRHSLLPELKINGLIDRTIVSFSNSFYQNTSNFNMTGDKDSYVIFGGIN